MNCKIEKGIEKRGWKDDIKIIEGYYVTIPTTMGSSRVFVEHIHEAFSLVGEFDNNYDKFIKDKERLNEYCKNNPWTYQGT